MRGSLAALPPITRVADALSMTTEVLARELTAPTIQPPPWDDFEWRIARAVAAMQGVSTLLGDTLRWKGPESWRRFLCEQREQSVRRHHHIGRLLRAVDFQTRRAGIACVALKGAALIARGLYPAGARPMGDIDLLIRGSDANGIERALEDCGYACAFTTRRHRVFQPRTGKPLGGMPLGEHIDHPISIEVHTQIAERLPVNEVDLTEVVFPAAAHVGLNAYPSHAALMAHLLLHAAGNMRARALRLIQLHDIASLAATFRPADWEQLLAANRVDRRLWWAFPPLTLAARYYPGTIPSHVLPRLGGECPRLLVRVTRRQQLAEVSWSNIRIAAFPGIEWSHTAHEALSFMRSRLWPTREARRELKAGSAQIPGVSTVPWYGIGHGARVVRWLFTRPPRVQTLLAVRAALAQRV